VELKKRIIGLLLIALSFSIIVTSAFIYEQASQTTTQTILEIASITLNDSALGNIEEGDTVLYTPSNTSAVDNVISITTGKANVYMHIDTDLEGQSTYYNTYQIEVVVSSAPGTSTLSGTVATLSIGSPDTATGIDLDVAGDYVFDFQVTTNAKQVSGNQGSTVNITVYAESTSAYSRE
jgi:hypothetical protein